MQTYSFFFPFDASQPWGTDPDGIAALIASLQQHGTHIAHAEANLLEPAAPNQIMNAAMQAFSHIDILIWDLFMICLLTV
ncbi:hypothetical protein [Leptolyngbya sp. FACHB-17]|uniref:hypothetical protein n=1 Tax=unclassified Leptolyngbya TaxID=2650499 RepID=UPI0016801CE1|nr:hypothetical protein [Leptolyngbya sp. FACHB-17]MBD2081389.1 hypothetical protein [Leptolyngbya sp. FACHB-17]